jgi:predicted CxxxxCH...CXXCH cytochrome family protein
MTDTQANGHLTVSPAAFAADCATCHAYSGTSPVSSAPLCNVCHAQADPVAAGSGAGTCLSCHTGASGLPKGPTGTGFPSLAGAHATHMNLATALTCDSCHAGSGTGTTTHYANANARVGLPAGPAPVAIDATFKAKTGGNPAFAPAALTCSNVSCHGGQVTPGWQNGALNANTQCSACHAVAASAGVATQFNDAFGRHSQGTHNAAVAANAIACTTCHNMANGSPGALAHFKYLNTPAVDGVSTGTPADQLPSGTIVFDTAVVSGTRTYSTNATTQGNGSCALTCHAHIHTATFDTWTASGAPHPVPFLGGQVDSQSNGHLNATAATFAADCSACHAHSGTSPVPGSPLCVTCHTLADPSAAATGTGTCLSCHVGAPGLPAGPTGSAYPSIAGSHAKHLGLPTTLTCDSCHAGSGAGSATHYANANARVTSPTGPASVSIDAAFNAQSGGTASFSPSALTCASVSCHGGQVAPNWRTGTLVSTTQCSACHAINSGTVSSQFSDAIGRHSFGTHATAGAQDCTLCHDMTPANPSPGAVNHFAELNTPAVSSTNKLPSGTIKFKLTSSTYPITGSATYTISATTPEGDGGCALTCHGQNHDPSVNHWAAPKGSGVAHPVPFLTTDLSTGGNGHQTLTLAQFTAECATCHDQSGTTTKAGPVCTVCHTLGSPLAAGMTAGTCLSCHVGAAFPTQGPTGTAWPNLQGSHPKHLALATFTRTSPALPAALTASAYPDCEACHVGSVPGDAAQTHYSNANKRVATPITAGPASVSIAAAFNARSGTAGTVASPSAFTCSNVSCHGGQTSPGWQTGTLAVNATTYCIACHKITSTATQYNDATGRHNSPNNHNQTCDYCHDMTQAKPGAQNHFKYLDTTAVSGAPTGTPSDQFPSDTVKFGGGATPATGALTYTVTATTQGRGGCALSCHGQTHTTTGNTWN